MLKEPKSKNELIQKLVSKAKDNVEFKKKLLDNPKELIEEELKIKLPDSLKITTLEEKKDQAYLVLPLNNDLNKQIELTDEELNNVAGGMCWEACDMCP
jgi:hypothetical protein